MSDNIKRLYQSLGIIFFYGLLGIAQEKITKADYGEEKYHYQAELVFVMCVSNLIFAYATGSRRANNDKTPKIIYFMCALSYVGAMLCSNYALVHINYPTQVLGKSCKPVAVMIVCLLLRQKSYHLQKYLCVLTIVAGVILFVYNPKKAGDDGFSIGQGELWILASLTLDGCVASCQEYMKKHFQSPKSNMMLNLNLIALVVLTSQSLSKGTLFEFFAFVQRHPECIKWLLALGCCSAFGQYFIFSIVTTFGPLWCSIVTTTRKFFTILLSVILFGNAMTNQQWAGSILVFLGLSMDAYFSTKGSPSPAQTRKKAE